jgi:hypothetical protein
MVLITAGISVRGRSRQGAEVNRSIGYHKLEIVACDGELSISICSSKFIIFNFQYLF